MAAVIATVVLAGSSCGDDDVSNAAAGRYDSLDDLEAPADAGRERISEERPPIDDDVAVRDCKAMVDEFGVDLPFEAAADIGMKAICFEERDVATDELIGVLFVPDATTVDASRTTVDDVVDAGGFVVTAKPGGQLTPGVEELAQAVEREGGVAVRPGHDEVTVRGHRLDVRRVATEETLVLWRVRAADGKTVELSTRMHTTPSVAVERLDALPRCPEAEPRRWRTASGCRRTPPNLPYARTAGGDDRDDHGMPRDSSEDGSTTAAPATASPMRSAAVGVRRHAGEALV